MPDHNTTATPSPNITRTEIAMLSLSITIAAFVAAVLLSLAAGRTHIIVIGLAFPVVVVGLLLPVLRMSARSTQPR